jgi:hypothetical protein
MKINYSDFMVYQATRPNMYSTPHSILAHKSRLCLALRLELKSAAKCFLMRGNGEKRRFRYITSVLHRAVIEAIHVATGRARYISHSRSPFRSHRNLLPCALCQSFWMKRAFTSLSL